MKLMSMFTSTQDKVDNIKMLVGSGMTIFRVVDVSERILGLGLQTVGYTIIFRVSNPEDLTALMLKYPHDTFRDRSA